MECGQHGLGIRLARVRVHESETAISATAFITYITAAVQGFTGEHSNCRCIWDWYFSLTSCTIKQVPASYPAPPFRLFLSPCPHATCFSSLELEYTPLLGPSIVPLTLFSNFV